MFTVLSKTRNSNLFLIGALAIAVAALLALAIALAVSAPQPAPAPAARLSEAGSDYHERHPEWVSNVQNAALPVTGNSEVSDVATPLAESLKTPGPACESPVDCR